MKVLYKLFCAMTTKYKNARPGVGVAVFVMSEKYRDCIVLGRRKGVVGGGMFQIPGGHLEFGESWESAAIREVHEETGLTIKNVKVCTVVNTVELPYDYHYVTVFLKGDVDETKSSVEPQNMEPNKCEGWNWIKFEDMPSPDKLFYSLRSFCLSGKNPFYLNDF